ncbi:MAG: metalloregulator ArsR/SmtB family transcription factor [Actinomycetota bacterium]
MASTRTRRQAARVALEKRELFDGETAERLEALFKVLANGSRLRMVHAIHRAGELSVNELAEIVGMSTQAVSNQLQRLADRGVLRARRNGAHVHYRIVDPCVPALMDRGVCLIEQQP